MADDFGINAARGAGYTDDQIADYVAKQIGTDIEPARRAGYNGGAILDYIVSSLNPPKAAEPETAPELEPPKRQAPMTTVARSFAQGVADVGAGVVTGHGAGLQMIGSAIEKAPMARRQIDIMDKIDNGAGMGDFKDLPNMDRLFAREYQVADPERRSKVRQDTINKIADPTNAQIGASAKHVGEQISEAGKGIVEAAEKAMPIPPEAQEKWYAIAPRIGGGLVGYLGAAALGGLPAVIGVAGIDSMGKTYEEAKAAGASEEEAAGAALISGSVQGGLNAVPMSRALGMWRAIPTAGKSKFAQGAATALESGGTLLAFSELSKLADNAIAQQTFDPNRSLKQGLGENMGETFGVGAVIPAVPAAANAAARRFRPRLTAADVMKADTVDEAIHTAADMARAEPVDVEGLARQADEYGLSVGDQRQLEVLKMFNGLNEGELRATPEGSYFYKVGDDMFPLKAWDERSPPAEGVNAITPDMAAQIRDTYGKLGMKIVFIDDAGGGRQNTGNARVAWDGAVDPSQPDTMFVSNNPSRAPGQLVAHEVTHLLENIRLQDGTRLGDEFFRLMQESTTPEGLEAAGRMFGSTAPDVSAFPATPEGRAAHQDALLVHLIRELGAEVGGEAPKFATFGQRVFDAVEARLGPDAAKGALRSLVDGLRDALGRLRQLFFKSPQEAEYGGGDTISQRWVTNLEAVHDTLAKLYAEKYASQVERERAMLEAQRPKPVAEGQRLLPAPAIVTPPPRPGITPENVFRPETYGASRDAVPTRTVPAPEAIPALRPDTFEPVAGEGPLVEPPARRALRPSTSPTEASLAAHDRLVATAKMPEAGAPKDYTPTPEELTLAQRVSRGWTPQVMEQQPQSLVDFVRKNGGLRLGTPEAGDMRAADIGRQPGLLRLRGMSADDMARAALDNGYRFGPDTEYGNGVNTDAFVRALIEDASGRRKHHPETADTAAWRVQRDYLEHFGNYLADIGLDPKGVDARTVAWVLKQSPEQARIAALLLKHDRLGEQSSIELAHGLDGEIAAARAEMTPEPGAWDMGDPRELPQPTRAELERFYADYERATGQGEPDAGSAGRPERAASGETAGGGAAGAGPDAGRPAAEASRTGDRGEGVAFSPRRSELAQTQPLLDAREAAPEELSARQRQIDKERAELAMKGKSRRAGQQEADDLPLFGGDRQKTLFSPKATDTPEFKRWFGDSKVVDENGDPVVVYHGTAKKFPAFSKNKAAMGGITWFTSDKSAIERGDVGASGKGHVFELFASLKNPAGWKEYDRLGLGELKARGYDGAILPDGDGTFTGFVFEPTQLKSTDNRGTFDPDDKRMRYSPSQRTPEQKKTIDRVFSGEKPGFVDQLKAAREDWGRKVLRNMLDPYIGLKAEQPENYVAARMANSTSPAQAGFLELGTLKFDGDTFAMKDRNGGVQDYIARPLREYAGDWIKWVAGHRAEKLMKEGRENLMTVEDIKNLKSLIQGPPLDFDYVLSNGKTTRSKEAMFLDTLRKYHEFNSNVIDLNVEAGNISKKMGAELKADPFYVPFYRVPDDAGRDFVGPGSASGLTKQSAFKKLTGGTEKLNKDLWENAISNWSHMIDAALRNKTAAKIADETVRLGAAREMTAQEANHLSDKELKAKTTWVMKDGEKVYYAIEDPMILKAVSALDTIQPGGVIMDTGRWFARTLRAGVTSNPLFALRMLVRDTQNTLATSHVSANPIKNIADGFAQHDLGGALNNLGRALAGQELTAMKLDPKAADAFVGGGLMRLGSGQEGGIRRTTAANILDAPDKISEFWHRISNVARAYKEVAAVGEDVNRLAVYKQAREAGASHTEASFAARDLQDFTLKGTAQWVRVLTDLTPFLNARAQGLYKLGRIASDADRSVMAAVGGKMAKSLTMRAVAVIGAMAVADLALHAIYADDPDYKKRTDDDLNMNWWFKVGDTQFRIPKGFEMAAISRLLSSGAEVFFNKEMTGERWVGNLWNILGQNLQVQLPAALQPAYELATNESRMGRPITPRGLEDLRSEQQSTPNTTLISRGVSDVANTVTRGLRLGETLSPIQMDYLVQGYGGWAAATVLGMADKVARAFSSEPEKPESDLLANLTQGMVRNDPSPSSRYIDLLYKQGKEVERAYATYRDLLQRGRVAEAKEFFEDNKADIQKHGIVSSVMRLEGNLNKQIRLITDNPDMSGERKRLEIQKLTALKQQAAERAMAQP